MDHKLLAHEHDPERDVYRLLIGIPRYDFVPQFDDNGEPIRDDQPVMEWRTKLNAEGAPIPIDQDSDQLEYEQELVHKADEDGELMYDHGVHRHEQECVGFDHVEEIVFAAQDERWLDRDDEDIAAEQRRIVADALRERYANASAAARSAQPVKTMPFGSL